MVSKRQLCRALAFSTIVFTVFDSCAQEALDPHVKKAQITLRAFECSLLASEASEAIRLFTLGLNAGREFFAFAKDSPELFQQTLNEIPLVWNLSTGPWPSADFFLGTIFAAKAKEVFEPFGPEKELWKEKMDLMYRSKNCRAIKGS